MYLMRFITPSGISPARLSSSVTSRTAMYNSRLDCRVSLKAATNWFRSLCSLAENLIGGGATGVGAASGNFSAIDMVVGVGVNVFPAMFDTPGCLRHRLLSPNARSCHRVHECGYGPFSDSKCFLPLNGNCNYDCEKS